MSTSDTDHERWARFRFQVVGPLLASPPGAGELSNAIRELSQRTWKHPIHPNREFYCGFSSIERWYYVAKKAPNPIHALKRKVRKDHGTSKVLRAELIQSLQSQYREYSSWSFQLHHDNLKALVESEPSLGPQPAYSTLVRFMKSQGMDRRKRRGNRSRPGHDIAASRLESRETRSYEVDYADGLWHLDFHASKHISIVDQSGRRLFPRLLAVLDDHSRYCCHAQFYLNEDTEVLVHGFSQTILKKGLCRSLMSDRGAAMMAGEFTYGLEQLGIIHETTLPYSPHQNGKQEFFWSVVEGRFLAMLEKVQDLTLNRLNELLQAWVKVDYNQRIHSELRESPEDRYASAKSVARRSPSAQGLREAFRLHEARKIRKSDLTLSIEGERYEVPSAYRHLAIFRVAYARFDLSLVHLVDPKTGALLVRIFPTDKSRNASGERRRLEADRLDLDSPASSNSSGESLPPLLKQCMDRYLASGLPPAFCQYKATEEDEK